MAATEQPADAAPPDVNWRVEADTSAAQLVRQASCAAPEHVHGEAQVCIPFIGAGFRARWSTAAGDRRERVLAPDACCVVAPGQPHRFNWDRPSHMVSVYLPPALLEQMAGELDLPRADVADDFAYHSGLVREAGLLLLADFAAGRPPPALVIDSAACLIAAAVLRGARPARAGGPEPLPPRPLARVAEYVAAHLADDLRLADLAAAAGYSPYHFARRFRAATGLSPHRYVLARRVDAAKRLLADGDLALVDVALAVGFQTQSHFSQVFRTLVGASPKRFRDANRR